MKKINSMMVMLAMMVAALSLSACGGDDEEGGNGGNTSNYLEVTIDGKKYTQQFVLPFVTTTIPSDVDNSLRLSASIEEEFNGNLDFGIAIYHKSDINELLSSNPGTYNVIGNKKSIWEQAGDVHNLTLQIGYRNGNGNCEVVEGTHKVISIRKADNSSVTISGSFSALLEDNMTSYEVSGKYQVTVTAR